MQIAHIVAFGKIFRTEHAQALIGAVIDEVALLLPHERYAASGDGEGVCVVSGVELVVFRIQRDGHRVTAAGVNLPSAVDKAAEQHLLVLIVQRAGYLRDRGVLLPPVVYKAVGIPICGRHRALAYFVSIGLRVAEDVVALGQGDFHRVFARIYAAARYYRVGEGADNARFLARNFPAYTLYGGVLDGAVISQGRALPARGYGAGGYRHLRGGIGQDIIAACQSCAHGVLPRVYGISAQGVFKSSVFPYALYRDGGILRRAVIYEG